MKAWRDSSLVGTNRKVAFVNSQHLYNTMSVVAHSLVQIAPLNITIATLPVFDAFLLKQRLFTTKRLLSVNSPKLVSHVYEIIYNMSLPDVESNIPSPERHYLIDILNMFLYHMGQNMPSSVLNASLEHVISFADIMNDLYD